MNDDGSAFQVDALIAADGARGFGRTYVNNFEPNKLQQRFNGRIAMRAVAKATDLPKSFALPFCNLWLGSGAHLVHYPINDGKDVNLVLTLDAEKTNEDWQKELGNYIHDKGTSLESIHQKVLEDDIEPKPRSGNQEYLENILNKYL